jgi:nitrite reductase/ring-hydroxylating ferredoxin subunit
MKIDDVQINRPGESGAPLGRRDLRDGLPDLGFRDFWYPGLLSSQVDSKPTVVRMLGDDIVVVRSGNEILALANLCPHRGSPLSLGRSHFPGTISCAYHGWTFNARGECVAALAEGPDCPVVGKAKTRAYRAREKWGVVWLYMGEGEAPALEEDLFEELLEEEDEWTTITYNVEWKCGWKISLDNPLDSSHAQYIHRRSLYWLFRPVPGWVNLDVTPIDKSKMLKIFTKRQGLQGDYPGLGLYPKHVWWRKLGDTYNAEKSVDGKDSAGAYFEVRMPCAVRIPDFLDHKTMWIRWIVPIDENRSRSFFFYMRRGRGFGTLPFRIKNWLMWSWSVRFEFSKQDQWIVEAQEPKAPERLSRNDVAVIAWRRLAPQWAAERAQTLQNPKG